MATRDLHARAALPRAPRRCCRLARHVLPRSPSSSPHGEGRHVWDAEGNRYLDFFGGILTTMTAYDLPEVAAAVARAGREAAAHLDALPEPPGQVELAERIARLSGIPDARVFFTTSGTEANETALLMATHVPPLNQILALRNSHRGRSYARRWASPATRPGRRPALTPLQTLYAARRRSLRGPCRRARHLSDAEFIAACVADLRGRARRPAARRRWPR